MSSQEQHGLPESLGDYGGGVHARMDYQETMRLVERALRERWPIRAELRQALVDLVENVGIPQAETPRDVKSVVSSVAMMDRLNNDTLFKLLDKMAPDKHEVEVNYWDRVLEPPPPKPTVEERIEQRLSAGQQNGHHRNGNGQQPQDPPAGGGEAAP